MTSLNELHQELKQNIEQSQQRYQKYADQHRSTAPPFKIGDHVFVKAKYFHTTHPSRKLAEKNLGPYEIIGHPGTLSFTL